MIVDKKFFDIIPKIINWYIENYCANAQKCVIEKTHLERILDEWWRNKIRVEKGIKSFELNKLDACYLKEAAAEAANYSEELNVSKSEIYDFLDFMEKNSAIN